MGQLKLSKSLFDAVKNQGRRGGYSHTFYQYPAQFSNEFVKEVLEQFSKPGDIILDPFMGGGTTLVEAMALGRHAIGTDVNPIAHLISTAKTTLLSSKDESILTLWMMSLPQALNVKIVPSSQHDFWKDNGYQKDVPWNIRRVISLTIDALDKLPSRRLQRLARCALLQTGQWALDSKVHTPSVEEFRGKYTEFLNKQIDGLGKLRSATKTAPVRSRILCLNVGASELDQKHWRRIFDGKPSLVITSPPYPSVHVLYHRWQFRGRKETSAPFWIAGSPNGQGGAYYTMGGRSAFGLDRYFENLGVSFSRIAELISPKAYVVQLVAFSDVDTQLPRYVDAMKKAGFKKYNVYADNRRQKDGIWRDVPSRKWHATFKGSTPSSKELLLIHRKST